MLSASCSPSSGRNQIYPAGDSDEPIMVHEFGAARLRSRVMA
jgi:hypothetical protein